jgi:hypothetical protein
VLMQRKHVVGNVLDRVVEMERRLAALERGVIMATLEGYTTGAPTADGYLLLTLNENGVRVQYRVSVDKV